MTPAQRNEQHDRPAKSHVAVLAGALACLLSIPAAAKTQAPVDYGPPPEWAQYKEMAEATIRASMVDPESARFSWPSGYIQAFYKPMLAKRVYGYVTCGLVNGRNRLGGYSGNTFFIVVIDHDRVLYSEIASPGPSLIGEACLKANLPPASSMEVPDVTRPGVYGIMYVSGAPGIKIVRVFAGSAAERAGVKPGMVVTRINGVSVKASTVEAVDQLLTNIVGNADFELADGSHLTVVRP